MANAKVRQLAFHWIFGLLLSVSIIAGKLTYYLLTALRRVGLHEAKEKYHLNYKLHISETK